MLVNSLLTGGSPGQAPDPVTLTVGILAFNEVRHLEATCVSVLGAFSSTGIRGSVIIIDDGSSDGTSELMVDLCRRYGNINGFRHETNQGIGAVARSVAAHADGEYVMFVPGDESYSAETIAEVVAHIGSSDIVVGQRNRGTVTLLRYCIRIAVRASTRLWSPSSRIDPGGLNGYRLDLLRSSLSTEEGHLMMTETCMRMATMKPSVVVVDVEQIPLSHRRSSSVRVGNLIILARIHLRMLVFMVQGSHGSR
jgi:hypothetical protein